jgi:hypothetical protein
VDILWSLLTLPYAPVRGFTAVLRVISREAEAQRRNPIAISRQLEQLDQAAEAGQITPQERDEAQQRVLEPLTPASPASGPTGGSPTEQPPGTREQRATARRTRTAGRHRAPTRRR